MNQPARQITEPTRRNIDDELSRLSMAPNGRLDWFAFLSRLFELTALPSQDHRFPNMADDVWQHCVNNPDDWPDGWWLTDDRLDLLHGPDETFLRFLAEMVHPVVLRDPAERDAYLEVFNKYLAAEGWEIRIVGQVGTHPIYGGVRLEQIPPAVAVTARELGRARGDYVSQQIKRMEAALSNDDPALAIGSAKDFIETICKTILEERRISIPRNGKLPGLVKLTVNSLPVVPADIKDRGRWEKVVVRLVNNLSSIGTNLAELRNTFGTGHGKPAGHIVLDIHHARLAVGMATTVSVFLNEVHESNPPG